jgi:putative DNA primase/helicase
MVTLEQIIQSGLAVIPIPLGEKGPCTEGWNLRKNCIKDPRNVGQLVGQNIGLAHAYCTPTPTCAIDIDHLKHASEWLASHGLDSNSLLFAPDSVVIWSGKNGSLKLLYRLPGGASPLESKKIVGPDGKSALEFRCATKDGKTVQDLLPPSIHPNGKVYQWVGNGNPLQLPVIQPALVSLWLMLIANASRVALRSKGSRFLLGQRQESPREIANLRHLLSYISADCPYEVWRNVVWAILSTGWLSAEDLAQQWSMSAPNRYEEDAFWVVANSYLPDHPNRITLGTIFYHAQQGGWHG